MQIANWPIVVAQRRGYESSSEFEIFNLQFSVCNFFTGVIVRAAGVCGIDISPNEILLRRMSPQARRHASERARETLRQRHSQIAWLVL